jgi:glucan phosphoethanolaminetransferase (alkaline phosphatase superfamily)
MHSADGDHSSVPPDALARLFKSSRMNAVIAWVLVGMLGLVVVESVLDVDRLWILFTTLTAAIVLIPPMAYREWRMMLPWELLSVALLPIWVRALFGGELGTFGYYLSVAGLALIVTVELHMFTSVRLTHWFAVLLVVLTTLASVAAWSVVRWNLDQQFGTQFLIEPETTQDAANAALMGEFIWVTLAGLAAGVLFDAYFRGRGRQLRRRLSQVVRR